MKKQFYLIAKSFDDKFSSFVRDNLFLVFFLMITLIGFIARMKGLPVHTNDMSDIIYYCNILKEFGIGNSILSDYTQPYLLMLNVISSFSLDLVVSIKGLSIAFDVVCALFASLLVKEITGLPYKSFRVVLTYAIVWLLPSVIFNGSYWGQSDSIYTAFLLISFYLLVKERYAFGFLIYGISVATKMTAVCYLPFLLLLFFYKKKFSVFNFFLIPVGLVLFSIPSVLAGKPIQQTINPLINYGKDNITRSLYNGYNNFWTFFSYATEERILALHGIGMFLSLGILCILLFIFIAQKDTSDNHRLLGIAIVFALFFMYFTPGMHERYFFSGDILSICYVMTANKAKKYYVPLIINMHSIYSCTRYIADGGWTNESIGTILILFALVHFVFMVYFTMELYQELNLKQETNSVISKRRWP